MQIQSTLLLAAALVLTVCPDARAAGPVPLSHIDHPYQRIIQLFAAIPDPTTLNQTQFVSAMGSDVSDYLTLFGIAQIESLSGQVKLSLTGAYNGRTKAGTKIQIDPQLTFTYQVSSGGQIDCDNIKGLRVKPIWLLGWMPLKHITVTIDTIGNTTIKVLLETIIGTVPHNTTLDQDGKQMH